MPVPSNSSYFSYYIEEVSTFPPGESSMGITCFANAFWWPFQLMKPFHGSWLTSNGDRVCPDRSCRLNLINIINMHELLFSNRIILISKRIMNLVHSLVPLAKDSQAVSHQPKEESSLLDINVQEILFNTHSDPHEAYAKLKKCKSALMKMSGRAKSKEDPDPSSSC